MKKPRLSIRVFLILCLLLGAVAVPVGWRQYLRWEMERREKIANITGRWKVLLDGQPVDLDGRPLGLVIEGGELTFDGRARTKIKTDSSTTPFSLDMTAPDGTVTKGIYRLDGGRVTIVYGSPDGKRPTSFDDSSPGVEKVILEKSK